MTRTFEYIRTALLAGSMGAVIPLADLPTLIEIAGPLAAALGHYTACHKAAPYWAYTDQKDGKLRVWIQRRWLSGPWPDAARAIDHESAKPQRRYDGTVYTKDTLLVGTVDPSDDEADEKMVELVATAKSAIRSFKSHGKSENELDVLERRAKRMLKGRKPRKSTRLLTRG